MEEKKQGFFAQIDIINNNLKLKQTYAAKFQEYDNSKRICMALLADGADNYTETKETVKTIKEVKEKEFSFSSRQLAYQRIVVETERR